jgi:hypothetical protein
MMREQNTSRRRTTDCYVLLFLIIVAMVVFWLEYNLNPFQYLYDQMLAALHPGPIQRAPHQ